MYRGERELLEEMSDKAKRPLTIIRVPVNKAVVFEVVLCSIQCIFLLHSFFIESMEDKTKSVKLRIQMEMSGPKSCEALASTCRLHCSLAGCLEFRSSGRSRRVRSRAEKKLKKDKSKLRRSRLLS